MKRGLFDHASRIILIGLVCLTAGKLAYYSVELAVRPAKVERNVSVAPKADRLRQEPRR